VSDAGFAILAAGGRGGVGAAGHGPLAGDGLVALLGVG
jgi:hypothetical protein